MSESAVLFNHSLPPSENVPDVVKIEQTPALADGGKRKQQNQQPRQLLSCTKCRKRKVKCDRTKPCSACCARGLPKECHFVAEGGDYTPIQQSYELRKLRQENHRLRERLRVRRVSIDDDDVDCTASPDSPQGDGPVGRMPKRRPVKQRRFQGSEWSDSIYFGSPGLASVINEFANINVTASSPQSLTHLTHPMPRGVDMYAPRDLPLYPFATLFSWSLEVCIPQLLGCLPPKDELFGYLDAFQNRVHVCFFPHIPTEITKNEVERFLSDDRMNAERCPDMLALLFAALALGSQHCVWDKCGGRWVAGAMQEESERGNLYIAAAMQALRMASYMNRPTLLGIQALIMIGPYLTNSGRFLDAWTLFGTTIRLAQSIGLHRHPKYLDPAPPTERECSMRQTLWWWMLHLDQQYSMTLGRPLGISGIGDCAPPLELTTDARYLRFGQFVHKFTILARQILSSDRLSNTKIDEFTDALRGLLDTMPEMLQFNETWLDEDQEIPEWPLGAMAAVLYCKTHNYLILLNRQRVDKQTTNPYGQPPFSSAAKSPPPAFHPIKQAPSSHPPPIPSTKATLRGRPLVLASSEHLLTAFLFFYARVPVALICWTIGQQAFNSCMILLLDALETGDLSRIWKVEKAYAVFHELDKNGVHKLANLAVERVSWGLSELKRMQNHAATSGRIQPRILKRGGHEKPDTGMQGADGSEATPCSGTAYDTVMGNTGMLLLEDPGLQSFVREAFSPLTWVMAGAGLEAKGTAQLKQQEEDDQQQWNEASPGMRSDSDTMSQGAEPHTARSSEQLQGYQGSAQESAPGSAPARYGTFSVAALQEQNQPQGLTSPRSPPSLSTTMMQQAQAHDEDMYSTVVHPPPHLRHHSYPSVPQPRPTLLAPHTPYTGTNQKHGNSNAAQQGRPSHMGYVMTPSGLALPQPTLQALPEPTSQQPLYEMGNPSVHPVWAARPAAPIPTASEPTLSFPHVSESVAAIPVAIPHQAAQQNTSTGYQHSFPFRLSSAGHEDRSSVAATAGTLLEQIEVEGWRRWIGSSGAG